MARKKALFPAYFLLFLLLSFCALYINHIDDTDETYGYWEPLHYLLFKTGMQTWEYSPMYAIRTYSFLYPVYLFCKALIYVVIPSKVTLFYTIRALLGLLTSYSQAQYVTAIGDVFCKRLSLLVAIFMMTSPGVFFSSTAFLPSAVAMNFVMLSCASCLRDNFVMSIFWGSLAVLWTGWPFVALLFAPLGLYMIGATYAVAGQGHQDLPVVQRLTEIIKLLMRGAIIVVAVFAPAVLLDRFYYGKWTVPSANILLYNAIGGSGDELYGVEPASYYARNLLLNLGLAWPLALATPVLLAAEAVLARWFTGAWPSISFSTTAMWKKVTVASLAVLWLGVLFLRPHKEERFVYPVYPVIAFIAAIGLQSATLSASAMFTGCLGSKKAAAGSRKYTFFGPRKAVWLAVLLPSTFLFISRVASNYNNYSGYISLWTATGDLIAHQDADRHEVVVCTGGEWYQFPSHFFLPANARLEYIRDGFTGILPQHFATAHGTSTEPLQPFNDRNAEEPSRYVPLSTCDYLVLIADSSQDSSALGPLRSALKEQQQRTGSSDGGTETVLDNRFKLAVQRDVVSAETSTSTLGRAFLVPGLSRRTVRFKQYSLYQQRWR